MTQPPVRTKQDLRDLLESLKDKSRTHNLIKMSLWDQMQAHKRREQRKQNG